MKTKGLTLNTFGSVEQALTLEEQELPSLQPDEVRLEMKAAAINPADLNLIEGKYPLNASLPCIIGHEGVGVVREYGERVNTVSEGDHAIVYNCPGAWCTVRQVKADNVIPITKDIAFEQAAMMTVNPPTAWLMLRQFVKLNPGDWAVQNAANSVVGRWVIHLCSHWEVRSMNVVRREELLEPLRQEGADEVILGHERFSKTIQEQIGSDGAKLALNAVGGKNAAELAKTLAKGGTHLTYGAMGREPLSVPNGLLIFNGIQFKGFWLTNWYRQAGYDEAKAMIDQLAQIAVQRSIEIPIAKTYPLKDYAQALEHAGQGGRGGKVLFTMG